MILILAIVALSLAAVVADGRTLTTQSSWASFKNCRKKYHNRYVRGLVPANDDRTPLFFGKDWDRVLNAHYLGESPDPIIAASQFRATLLPMWVAYRQRWAMDDQGYEVMRMQIPFQGDIVNPETGSPSRSFVFAGVADGLWRLKADGTLWLNENKTSSRVDADYLDRLWLDWQTTLYIAYLEPLVGPIAGVVWNIAEKPSIRRSMGETDAEFAERQAEAKQPNRIKRKAVDTDDEWAARLTEHYANNPQKFHREVILLDRGDIEQARNELWDLSQSYLEARRRDAWYRNTAYCHHYGRSCEYLPLCRSRDNPIVVETQYRVEAPHQEVAEAVAAERGGE